MSGSYKRKRLLREEGEFPASSAREAHYQMVQRREILKTSEELLKAIADQLPVGISIIDQDGKFEYVNPQFVEIFGYTLKDISNQETWFKRAYPDASYRNQILSARSQVLRKSDKWVIGPKIFRVTCKDSTEKLIEFKGIIMPDGKRYIIYQDIMRLSSIGVNGEVIVCGEIVINHAARDVTCGQKRVMLTPTEYKLLYHLVKNVGAVLTYEALLGAVWGEAYAFDIRLVQKHVQQLRKKLGDDAKNPRFIVSKRSFGYKFAKAI